MCTARWLRHGGLILLLLLSACGFQLRGTVVLPPVLQATQLEGDRFSLLVSELGRVLQNAGARLVDSRSQASAVLKVLDETSSQRVLSVGVAGRAAEYELHHRVDYQLEDAHGQVLVEKQTLDTRRSFQFDENDVLGKANEEESLREEMQRDLALRIVQQLSMLAR
jgi:LPS-assembly lipoprotein